MKTTLITLRAAAEQLDVRPHRIVYAITSGKAKEPIRISGRRMFRQADLDQLRKVVKPRPRRGKEAP